MELYGADTLHEIAELECSYKKNVHMLRIKKFAEDIMNELYERAKEGYFFYTIKLTGSVDDNIRDYELLQNIFVEKGYKVIAIAQSTESLTFKIKW